MRSALLLWLPLLACNPDDADVLVDGENPLADALDWETCRDGLQCAALQVDDGELQVLWAPAVEHTGHVGVLASGGPGGSSVRLLDRYADFADDALEPWFAQTDWVAIDARGTGARGVRCVDDDWYDRLRTYDAVPTSTADRDALGLLRDEFIAGCSAELDDDQLVALGTPTAADDLDALRDTLGVDAVSFIGTSYGTWLGAVYAKRYPDRVENFVLDSVVGPAATRDVFLESQAEGFENALSRFFEWCNSDDECSLDDPADTYDRLLASTPIAVPTDSRGRSITRNELRWAVTMSMYQPSGWPGLAEVLAAADDGVVEPLMAAADSAWGMNPDTGRYDAGFARYLAIGCVDQPWPEGWTDDDVFAFGEQLDVDYPRLGGTLITGELACQDWPVREPAFSIADSGAPPMLLAAGRHDPATPWQDTVDLLDALDNDSQLLTWEGDGHGVLWRSGCTFWAITDFLLDGTRPDVEACTP